MTVLGRFEGLPKDDQAILILEKGAFTEDQVLDSADEKSFLNDATLNKEFINDIYANFTLLAKPEVNRVKTTLIYPATEKHIQKYSIQNVFIVQETSELFKEITEPYLSAGQFSLEWVYNIIDHKKEADRIVYEDSNDDTGFILLPDLKWDGKTKETLYLIAISRRRDLRSLRDLTADHLPLLKNIRDNGVAAIEEKYGIKRSQLRIYVHYQPSFYHFHVHFTYLKHDAPGIYCERSHLLDSIISNIELLADYYQKSTLSFTVRESDALYTKYAPLLNQNCDEIITPEIIDESPEPKAKKIRTN